MTTFYQEFQKVFLSVDCIIFGFDDNKDADNSSLVVANGASMEASSATTRVLTTLLSAPYLN